jgi:hypothetical protein
MPEPSSSIHAVPGRIAAAAEHALAVDQREADVDLDRRLGEREVARPQPQHDVLALEERLEEGLERPLEVAEVDVAIDHQAFDLVEHRRVRRRPSPSGRPARRDDPQAGACGKHRPHLHRAGVRPEQHASVRRGLFHREIERVVHRPRRMAFGHVERGEVVPVALDLRPGRHREAEIGEDFGEFVHHLADRVHRSPAAPRARATSGRPVSVASRASSAAASIAALRSASASLTACRKPWISGPFSSRSSGLIAPAS